ncbi:hypothetical protein A7979_04875 [Rothia nasimurium]|uniref:Uncharacterized protein n=1 Tax=Rothia nasimurium TaxID=85336 RepID=A0A1Y1RMY8_9MICC|nr:hypothetical protein A7979_04875 [Rothia nasimurium]
MSNERDMPQDVRRHRQLEPVFRYLNSIHNLDACIADYCGRDIAALTETANKSRHARQACYVDFLDDDAHTRVLFAYLVRDLLPAFKVSYAKNKTVAMGGKAKRRLVSQSTGCSCDKNRSPGLGRCLSSSMVLMSVHASNAPSSNALVIQRSAKAVTVNAGGTPPVDPGIRLESIIKRSSTPLMRLISSVLGWL